MAASGLGSHPASRRWSPSSRIPELCESGWTWFQPKDSGFRLTHPAPTRAGEGRAASRVGRDAQVLKAVNPSEPDRASLAASVRERPSVSRSTTSLHQTAHRGSTRGRKNPPWSSPGSARQPAGEAGRARAMQSRDRPGVRRLGRPRRRTVFPEPFSHGSQAVRWECVAPLSPCRCCSSATRTGTTCSAACRTPR